MKTVTPTLLKILTLLGLFSIVIPISIIGLWMHSCNLGADQADRVSIFNSYFPDFLHGTYSTTLLSIVFCVIAIILSIICLKTSKRLWKIINIVVIVISGLLLFLNMFSLM